MCFLSLLSNSYIQEVTEQRIGDCLFCVSRCRPLRRHFVRWRLPTAGHPGPLPEPAGGEERAVFRLQTAERHFRPHLGGTAPRTRKWRQVRVRTAQVAAVPALSALIFVSAVCFVLLPVSSLSGLRWRRWWWWREEEQCWGTTPVTLCLGLARQNLQVGRSAHLSAHC